MNAKEAKQELKAMCPNCDGSGCIPNGVTKMSYGYNDYGEPIETGTYIEWEQEPCEWCDVFDRKLQSFIDQLCMEQRENCYEAFHGRKPVSEQSSKILNAPKPTI